MVCQKKLYNVNSNFGIGFYDGNSYQLFDF